MSFTLNAITSILTSFLTFINSIAHSQGLSSQFSPPSVNKIINTRERTKKELLKLGFSFPDSKANFIFAKHDTVSATKIMDVLRDEKIFVRHFTAERIENYLRITIGTDEQMDKMLQVLKNFLTDK